MSIKTSTYFFPSSTKTIKQSIINNSLLSYQKRQLRDHLQALKKQRKILLKNKIHSTQQRYSKQSLKSRYSTVATPSLQKKKVLNKHKINNSLYDIFQTAKLLKQEDQDKLNDPFYKIQKKRLKNLKIKTQLNQFNLRQSAKKQQNYQNKTLGNQLFTNQRMSQINLQCRSPKIRVKSQTVTYYQIKKYFQQKYQKKSSIS